MSNLSRELDNLSIVKKHFLHLNLPLLKTYNTLFDTYLFFRTILTLLLWEIYLIGYGYYIYFFL